MTNFDKISCGTLTLPVANTAKKFPDVLIPEGREVRIKAPQTNGGVMRIAESELGANDAALSFPLDNGEHVDLKIKNLGILWVSGNTNNDQISWIVEQCK
jgi:hypothetical protein